MDRATAIPDGIAMQIPVSKPHAFPRVSISWVGHVSASMKFTPTMPTRNPTPTQMSKENDWKEGRPSGRNRRGFTRVKNEERGGGGGLKSKALIFDEHRSIHAYSSTKFQPCFWHKFMAELGFADWGRVARCGSFQQANLRGFLRKKTLFTRLVFPLPPPRPLSTVPPSPLSLLSSRTAGPGRQQPNRCKNRKKAVTTPHKKKVRKSAHASVQFSSAQLSSAQLSSAHLDEEALPGQAPVPDVRAEGEG